MTQEQKRVVITFRMLRRDTGETALSQITLDLDPLVADPALAGEDAPTLDAVLSICASLKGYSSAQYIRAEEIPLRETQKLGIMSLNDR